MSVFTKAVRFSCLSLLVLVAQLARAESFVDAVARVDAALKKNPGRVTQQARESCLRQRGFALRLYDQGQVARAERSLAYCFRVLHVSKTPPPVATTNGKKRERGMAAVQEAAARELEQALDLEPDLAKGLEIYRGCAACHMPEGWGYTSGSVPQLAGQHNTVVIKQLADIRAGNRETVLMAPYASIAAIGGVQSVADVAGYIDTLEITIAGGKGPGDRLELGEELYRKNCRSCHGEQGEGNPETFAPRIQAQHYNYLVRQFEWIRDGKRRNANAEMKAQIADFDEQQMSAVLDYVSRLEPPPELQAPPGWTNPDFAE